MKSATPVQALSFFGHQLWLKRDDLLPEPFSGNKGRKFASLLTDHFPGVDTLIGYGSPQSNSLYSMAALAERRGWQLEFYVDHIAKNLYRGLDGNYGGALAMGARVIEVPGVGLNCADYIEQVRLADGSNHHCLYVPEGGRCALAQTGVWTLGQEILDWYLQQSLGELSVFLPSGTGTTAAFLSEFFYLQQAQIRVVTCPVVGSPDYLVAQFSELVTDTHKHPTIVGSRHQYASLSQDELEIWGIMLRQGVEFDLLYDPCGLLVLRSLLEQGCQGHWLYLHQGGLRGNVSMTARYRRKFPDWFSQHKPWVTKYW